MKKDTKAYCSAEVKMKHKYNHTDSTNFRSCSY